MYPREIGKKVLQSSKKYRAIGLIGPRQSGKTTLAQSTFSEHKYISLENPDHRQRALEDPRLFLKSLTSSTILDEVQNTPLLFSYLQEVLDDKSDDRQFILTGSNSFQLNEKISQSLAGRIRLFQIMPLMRTELPDSIKIQDLDQFLITGLYPRIYDQELDPYEWFSSYYQTYLQKDIKSLVNVSDTNQFDRFVRMCAARTAQLSDYSKIAMEIGVSQPTAVRWASVLESSFITFRLSPHFRNFNKKIIKTPKLYFYDSGLLCQLLKIGSAEQLIHHPMRGEIFENYIVSESIKKYFNQGMDSPLYFWRDTHGHEIDLVVDEGPTLRPLEIKSGSTFQSSWLKNLRWFSNIQPHDQPELIYGGDDNFSFEGYKVTSWRDL